MGPATPFEDLYVSPKHRVFMSGGLNELYFGQRDVLVPAKCLINGTTIDLDKTHDHIEYVHVLFEEHEILRSNGLLSESLFWGDQISASLPQTSSIEFQSHFGKNLGHAVEQKMFARHLTLQAFEARLIAG